MARYSWLILIFLVVGSVVGVAYLLKPGGDTTRQTASAPDPEVVVCAGHVDVEDGIAAMYPRLPGLVTFVASESNQLVKGGTVLLQVDDELAKIKLEEARFEEKAAKETLAQLQHVESTFPVKIKAQQVALDAATATRAAKDRAGKARMTQYEGNSAYENVKKAVEEDLRAADLAIQVEEQKLADVKAIDPTFDVRKAAAIVGLKEAQVKEAEAALKLYQIAAPSDGYVLRVFVHKGEVLGASPRTPAVQFLPAEPKIVRAEVQQEWGAYVKEGQKVRIEDDTYAAHAWEGEVKRLSPWYDIKRSQVIEPFTYNDVRTLECIIKITGPEDGLRIGQRVRAKIAVM